MKNSHRFTYILALSAGIAVTFPLNAIAAACSFDNTKNCTLFRDILNDKTATGLKYYAATNYDHRISGEINVFDATLVTPYTDGTNAPGQLKLIANKVNSGFYKSGEIMTRINLNQPPYNSPTASQPFTTNDISHGYVVATVKLPKCDISDDNLCQNGTAPESYTRGLWPSVWMLPTTDTNWPQNGEIDTFEAYKLGLDLKTTTATLHFNGTDSRCQGGDCRGAGYSLTPSKSTTNMYTAFHSYGLEWEPDPASTIGGVIMNGYFDNVKVWGPLRTDTLPADGPNAFARGFHDPKGGFYLIAALAVGGPYAGAPNAHLQQATMYVQSIKAYSIGGAVPNTCRPPVNIQNMYSPDKKQVTLAWMAPPASDTIQFYQVADWQNRIIWKGTKPTDRAFQDQTLPGTAGKFTYILSSVCPSGKSADYAYDVNITLK